MSTDAPPMVDINDIMRLVGPTSFQRGLAYSRGGAVHAVHWDLGTRMLTGSVQGTKAAPYQCSVVISNATGKPTSSLCSCPMNFDCKHVAATLLQSNTMVITQLDGLKLANRASTRALKSAAASPGIAPAVPAVQLPEWKTAVAALSDPGAVSPERTTAMGLQFELREQIPRSRNRWNGPSAQPARAPITTGAVHRLAVRPVVKSATGNWVRGTLTWNLLGYQTNRLDLVLEQQRWFAQFAALHRATRDAFSSQEADWLYLDDFFSPLLWALLRDAALLGIALVTGKKETNVTVGDTATVSMNATLDESLRLTPVLSIDGNQYSVAATGTIGDHGVYCWEFEPRPRFTLAPTSAPLSVEQRGLLDQSVPLVVPAGDVDEFLRDFYPKLSRTVLLTSADESVQFPEIVPATLVLTITFRPKQTIIVTAGWQYGTDRKPLSAATSTGSGDRDSARENEVLGRVEVLVGTLPPSEKLVGLAAAEFADKVLPALQLLEGVTVELIGKRPDYTELVGTPKLVVTTVATDRRDWFDLGVYVTIDGRNVPFAKLFTALTRGESKLLLVDNSYLSLAQPVFDELRRLIEEASSLAEWETGVRISRYQASLWSEFEDLADETEQAVAWRDAAAALIAPSGVLPTPLPAGVNATLRPYQQDGFDWLAFLWAHQLGGILADDMGLGKTLQALALIQHAVLNAVPSAQAVPSANPTAVVLEGRRPFLVVAPTSVVSNWITESVRFTPGLVARSVSTTKQSLTELAAGADIVVTSYALFRIGFDEYQELGWAGLILDEAQFVKNPASKAHDCAVLLDTPFKLAITGTPMENSLTDLWSLFSIVAPGLFASNRRFTETYVRPIAAGERPDLLAQLRRRIRPLMMRRTKELVATDLPAKQEQVLRVELAPRHRKLYDIVLQKERQKLLGLVEDLDRNRFIVFRSLTLLRMMSLDASLVDEKYADIPSSKLDALFEQLEDVVAESHRALVFSQFTSFLKKAAARMDAAGIRYEYLDGSTLKRSAVIKRFKDGDTPVFLISLKAGGFGLNLTEADYVFLLDPWWNPATETQAIDRTHRIGQTRSVNVYRLVSNGTIEEKVMALKEQKAALFDAVMDDDAVFSTALTADDIRGLLES